MNVIPERIDHLVGTLDVEAGVLSELRESLVKQREAVANDDKEAVENSIHAIGRIILTLEETRQQRRSLVGLLCDGNDVALSDLDEYLPNVPEQLIAARESVREQATATANDLAINQQVLDRVLQAGDSFLQRLFSTALEVAPSYAEAESEEHATAAMLVNRTV